VEQLKSKYARISRALALALAFWPAATLPAKELPFNDGWQFVRDDAPQASAPDFDASGWQAVTLPNTAHIEPLADGHEPRAWQGICWYRKSFDLPASAAGKDIFLRFDGAMNAAEIWVNGQSAGKFMGGYLPYVMDITPLVHVGTTNVVVVRLDNRDNPITGPKLLADLDFNLYGGLYRQAHLIIQDKLHITDPILANGPASGGVFVTYPEVSPASATVQVQTHIQNDEGAARTFTLRTTLLDAKGHKVASVESPVKLAAGTNIACTQTLKVKNPKLWSPNSPYLYSTRSELVEHGAVTDATQTRIGIRHLEITKDGFFLNGEKMFLRGCNRHQEYPYVGNALSDAAQYRDALHIKEAGFDYVRLSHYPQSPAFLDACDELGIIVMDSIFGWQYFNQDPAFAAEKYQESRQLIRRDRNHPCIALWEVSLNESDMPRAFVKQAGAIAHEEYPGDQCYTAGWKFGYNVFLQARQHGGCHGITNQACLISEYGDWEYYAQNAGFAQDQWKDLQPAARSSRQFRGDGEARMLQQALNFQEAHNDDLQTPAFGDGIWVMFDYSRGYAPDLEASGVMDVFRLPKFSYWLFRTQRDPAEIVAGQKIGPQIFIANNWTTNSPTQVRVFSNCEEVALHLNGQLVERRRPDSSRFSTHLKHAPFTFNVAQFQPGTLKATGYIADHAVATDERQTPGEISQMSLAFDLGDRPFAASGKDLAFCHATVKDANGTPIELNNVPVYFGTSGQLKLVQDTPAAIEAGIATALVDADQARPADAVYALCLAKDGDQFRILSAATTPGNDSIPAGEIHYTLDGTVPTVSSPLYSAPVADPPQLRAGLFVNGKLIAVTK